MRTVDASGTAGSRCDAHARARATGDPISGGYRRHPIEVDSPGSDDAARHTERDVIGPQMHLGLPPPPSHLQMDLARVETYVVSRGPEPRELRAVHDEGGRDPFAGLVGRRRREPFCEGRRELCPRSVDGELGASDHHRLRAEYAGEDARTSWSA